MEVIFGVVVASPPHSRPKSMMFATGGLVQLDAEACLPAPAVESNSAITSLLLQPGEKQPLRASLDGYGQESRACSKQQDR